MRTKSVLPLVFSLLPALHASCSGGGDSGTSGASENVILVTLDTTRPDFFGAWGMPGDPTPHFDALAEDGVRFSTAVSSSAVTPVSHASILTGRAPYGHGLRILAGPAGFQLPETVPTLASVLKERGYSTGAFHSAFPVSAVYGFARGFDKFEDVTGTGLQENEQGGIKWDVTKGQRRSDETNRLVLDFVKNTAEPYFIWIHYWDPHDPYMMPPDDFLQDHDVPRGPQGWDLQSRERYGAEISYVDQQFGELVEALKQAGQYENTFFAIVADHGEGLDDGFKRHGWGAHRILYQEQIHVPLIVRAPGAPAGGTVDQLVRSVDIFPTVLDFLDIAPPAELEGRSLRNLMEGKPDEPRMAYADQINLWDANAKMLERRPMADFIHVIMNDEHKLIFRPSYPESSELYAYREDPGEMKNLFREPESRQLAISLLEELSRREGWVLEPYTAGEADGMSAKDLQTLQELGYIGGGEASTVDAINMWEWLCPREWKRLPSPGSCPDCKALLVPVARPK